MKIIQSLIATCGIVLATAATAAEGKRIATEKEFRELVVDRPLLADQARILNSGDGSLTGAFRGKSLNGTWNWVGDTYCRTATWGTRNLGYNCQAVFIDGDAVIFVRDEGRGRESRYRIGKR